MKNERRKSLRTECDDRLSLQFDNRVLEVDLRNMSTGGAFLRVVEEDSDTITSADTGQIVTFRLARNRMFTNYYGTINRYAGINDDKYLAVIFNEPKVDGFA